MTKLLTDQELLQAMSDAIDEKVNGCDIAYQSKEEKDYQRRIIHAMLPLIQSQKQAHTNQQVLQALEEVKANISTEQTYKLSAEHPDILIERDNAYNSIDQVATKYRGVCDERRNIVETYTLGHAASKRWLVW